MSERYISFPFDAVINNTNTRENPIKFDIILSADESMKFIITEIIISAFEENGNEFNNYAEVQIFKNDVLVLPPSQYLMDIAKVFMALYGTIYSASRIEELAENLLSINPTQYPINYLNGEIVFYYGDRLTVKCFKSVDINITPVKIIFLVKGKYVDKNYGVEKI